MVPSHPIDSPRGGVAPQVCFLLAHGNPLQFPHRPDERGVDTRHPNCLVGHFRLQPRKASMVSFLRGEAPQKLDRHPRRLEGSVTRLRPRDPEQL